MKGTPSRLQTLSLHAPPSRSTLLDLALSRRPWSAPRLVCGCQENKFPACGDNCGPFYQYYIMYEKVDPGSGMSGVGGGKKSQIAGCDWGVGSGNWMLTSPLFQTTAAFRLQRTIAQTLLSISSW